MGHTLTPIPINLENINGYELIDSGEGRKLESIVGHIVDRPCPQAIWKKQLSAIEWAKADSICIRTSDGGGHWKHLKNLKEYLHFTYNNKNGLSINCKLKLTTFGHCGIFFEQVPLWELLFTSVNHLKNKNDHIKVLNLFGYTGAASLAMAKAGAEVFHVDSAKGVLTWGKQNAVLSSIKENQIHWVCQDALEFLTHSKKKGFKYQGIFLDPPSWGHGSKKELFEYNKDIQHLISLCLDVLVTGNNFILLTSHTPGVWAHALNNLFPENNFKKNSFGDLGVKHQNDQRILPAGIYYLGNNIS